MDGGGELQEGVKGRGRGSEATGLAGLYFTYVSIIIHIIKSSYIKIFITFEMLK